MYEKNTHNCGRAYRDKVIGVMCANGHCYDEDCVACNDWEPDHWHENDGSMNEHAAEQNAYWMKERNLTY